MLKRTVSLLLLIVGSLGFIGQLSILMPGQTELSSGRAESIGAVLLSILLLLLGLAGMGYLKPKAKTKDDK